jgi:hypothetical protein
VLVDRLQILRPAERAIKHPVSVDRQDDMVGLIEKSRMLNSYSPAAGVGSREVKKEPTCPRGGRQGRLKEAHNEYGTVIWDPK